MQTPAHTTFVAPARAYPQIWRLLAGLGLTLLVYFIWILIVLGAVWLTAGSEALNGWMARMALATTPTSVLLMLSTFVGMAIGPLLAARWLHKRSKRSVFGPFTPMLAHFLLAMGIVASVLALSVILFDPGYAPMPNLEMSLWLSFLPLALVGVLVQTGAEEILFRGYLQQQLAARFNSPVMWMILPSLLFGALHYDPSGSSDIGWLLVAAATLFGLLAADLTRVTGNIGAAWGFHFANNCFAILIVALDGALSGLSLYTTPFTVTDTEILRPLIFRDMAITVGLWLLLRGVLHLRNNTPQPTSS